MKGIIFYFFKEASPINHEGVTYACGKCEYQPKDRSSLRKHQQAVLEGVRYKCEYKTGRPQSLYNHKQIKHTQPQ